MRIMGVPGRNKIAIRQPMRSRQDFSAITRNSTLLPIMFSLQWERQRLLGSMLQFPVHSGLPQPSLNRACKIQAIRVAYSRH